MRSMPLSCGSHDVADMMTRVLNESRADVKGIDVDHELRVEIVSPDLPPMNFIDLPGIVDVPADLKAKTRALCTRFIKAGKDRSMFLAIIEATTSPRNSPALDLLLQQKLSARTIGVLTKVDRVEEETFDDLVDRLDNKATVEDTVPLNPHGYVLTMNKALRARANEDALQRLHRRASAEMAWFRENGEDLAPGRNLVSEGKASTKALVAKIGHMYIDFVRETWLPRTVSRLMFHLNVTAQSYRDLGIPISGDAKLPRSAARVVNKLCEKCRSDALQVFTTQDLKTLEQSLTAPLTKIEVPLTHVQTHFEKVRKQLVQICRSTIPRVQQRYIACVDKIFRDDSKPFRLQRFPKLIEMVKQYLFDRAPQIQDKAIEDVAAVVADMVGVRAWTTDVCRNLKATLPMATIKFPSCDRIITAIMAVIMAQYTHRVNTKELESIVQRTVASETETCKVDRDALQTKYQKLDLAIRKLLHLTDEARQLDSKTPLDSQIAAKLPSFLGGAAAMRAGFDIASIATRGFDFSKLDEDHTLTIVTRNCNKQRVAVGTLQFKVIVRVLPPGWESKKEAKSGRTFFQREGVRQWKDPSFIKVVLHVSLMPKLC